MSGRRSTSNRPRFMCSRLPFTFNLLPFQQRRRPRQCHRIFHRSRFRLARDPLAGHPLARLSSLDPIESAPLIIRFLTWRKRGGRPFSVDLIGVDRTVLHAVHLREVAAPHPHVVSSHVFPEFIPLSLA